jgi:hypothetical protein
MLKNFFIAFSSLMLFSCQKNTNEALENPVSKSESVVDSLLQKPLKKEEKKMLRNDNEIYNSMNVDVNPSYKGGIQKFQAFLKKNYVTSKVISEDDTIGGGIFVSFVIEKDGSVSNIKVLRDFGYGSGKELERVLKLCPDWIPGMKGGNPVRCLYSIPYYVQ